MKKLFFGLTLLIVIIVGAVFGVLFTKSGNNFVASYIEDKVNDEQNNVQLKVNDFALTFNTISFNATINDNSTINVSGDLEIFNKKVDLVYDIKINELSKLEKLINQKLNGPFSTSGTFKGNEKLSVISGISDVAHSETKYNLELIDFEATDINFVAKDAKIDELLHLLNQKKFARGKITVKGDIQNAKIDNLAGKVSASISKGKILNEVFNKEFKQNLQTSVYFKSDIKADLTPNTATIKSDTITSLADLFTKNTLVDLKSGKVITDYKLDVKNLLKLQSVIGTKLNGNFTTTGEAVVNNGIIKIDGKSNLLDSLSKYNIKIADSKPEYIKFSLADAKIDKLLHLLNQPVYATGSLHVEGDLKTNEDQELLGSIVTNISNGKVINPVVNTVFKHNLKKNITFNGNIDTNLQAKQAVSKIDLKSTVANISTTNTVFNMKDSGITSDYLLNIPNLANLYDVTSTKMRGKLDVSGTLKSKSKALLVTGNSKLLGGTLDFNLKNDDLVAKVKNVEVKQLTHMLYYPEVFASKAALDLKYDLLLKRGKLNGQLLNGHFLPNDFSSLINQFAKFDLTREVYNTVDINSNINKMVLTSTVNMKSKNTQIDVTKSTLNLEKSLIDADIEAQIKKTKLAFKVKGNTKNPKIKVDTKGLLKKEVNKQLDKHKDKIKEKLNKVLKGKLGEDGAQDVLDNIKSLF